MKIKKIVVTLLLFACSRTGRAESYAFGQEPLSDVRAAAQMYANKCNGLTYEKLIAYLLSPTWWETAGHNFGISPSPMTLGRSDSAQRWPRLLPPGQAEAGPVWHPGIGAWQLDDSGEGSQLSSEKFNTRDSAIWVAHGLADRYCADSSYYNVFLPWAACASDGYYTTPDRDRCIPTFNAILEGQQLQADSGVDRYGGAELRICSIPAQVANFYCLYVDPAKAQPIGNTPWTSANFPATLPLARPFYVYHQAMNGHSYEWRYWLSADTLVNQDFAARRPYEISQENSRTNLCWLSTGLLDPQTSICQISVANLGLCDLSLSRGNCHGNKVSVIAKLDGQLWPEETTGSLHYSVSGASNFDAGFVPLILNDQTPGTYTLSYLSGGPPNSYLLPVTPSSTQTLTADGSITFTLNFFTKGPACSDSAKASCPPLDTFPPDTTITAGPNGSTNSTSPTFSWTGSDDVTPTANLVYAFKLDPIDGSYSGFSSATSHSYTNLSPGTYTFSVKARDQAGNEDPTPATQSFTVVTTGSVPSVVSVAASEITMTSGYVNAFVNPNGSATSIYFQYGLTTSYGSTTSSSPLGAGTGLLAASKNVTGLSCNTTYNFRAVAVNVYGTVYADNLTFTTSACSGGHPSTPAVTTTPASDVGVTSATFNATVNPQGETTTAYFRYGPTTGYGSSTTTQTVGTGTSAMPIFFDVVNLACNALYNYQVVAENAEGKGFGNNQVFVTQPCGGTLTPPLVTTKDAQGVDTSTAFLRATVNPRGRDSQLFFQYGLSTSYDLTTTPMSVGNGTADLTTGTRISGLPCNTLYNFRAVATSSDGTTYGDNLTFATASCGPDTELFSGVSLNDSITSSSSQTTYNFYYIYVPPNSIQLNVSVPIANGDVYFVVKAGTKPSQGQTADCGGTDHCAVQDPQPGIWWISLDNGPGTVSYTITATVTQSTGYFFTVTPCRLIDTRTGASGGPNGSSGVALPITGGACGIPSTATAVALNATATRPTADGFLSLSDAIGLPPSTSTVNFSRGQTRTNNTIVKLTRDGAMAVYVGMGPNDNVDYILDITGYFEESRPLVGKWRGTFGTYNDAVLDIQRDGNAFRAQFSAAGNWPNEMNIISISDTQFDALRPTDHNAEVRLSLVYSGVFPCLVGEYLENGGSRAVNLCMR